MRSGWHASLSLPEEEVERVRIAALLRDVGEVGVAESILNKAGPLIRRRAPRGASAIPRSARGSSGAAQLGRVGEWILTHHERPDGQRLPARPARSTRSRSRGRILAVADAYAAMTADRPYRRPFSPKRALAELQARAGTQFDHDVVEAFLALDGELDPDRDKARATEALGAPPALFRGQGARQLDEVVERRRVGERVAARRLLGRSAHQDPLHRHLEHLAAQGARHLGDLEDLVGDVARGAAARGCGA